MPIILAALSTPSVAGDFHGIAGASQEHLSSDGDVLVYTIRNFHPPDSYYLLGPGGVVELPGLPTDLSGDGGVVVGRILGGGGYVWSGGTYIQIGDFASTGEDFSLPLAVSRDGTVVVGEAWTEEGWTRAFRWSDGVLTDLGTLAGTDVSKALAVSGDGTVIAGDSGMNETTRAFVWSLGNPVLTDIGSLGGTANVRAISDDGTTIIGRSETSPGGTPHAFRWTDAGGMVDLGTFGGPFSDAVAVSFDGSVVVGDAEISEGLVLAFRWTEGDGLVNLGTLGGDGQGSRAIAVSSDGAIVVGFSDIASGVPTTGFRWDAAGGMQAIGDYLSAHDLDVEGWGLEKVTQISADGSSMAGTGKDGQGARGAWYAHCIDGTACALISSNSLAQSLGGIGNVGEAGNSYIDSTFAALGAALENAGPGMTASLYGAFDSDPAGSAGVVVSAQLREGLPVSFGAGTARIETPLAFGGNATFDALSLSAGLDLVRDAGFVGRLSLTAALFEGTINRGYLNGNTQVSSSGDTTGLGIGLEAMAGWRIDEALPGIALTPYVSLGLTASHYEGWTESGGPLPGVIDGFTTGTAILRAGAEAERALGAGTLMAGLALAHRETGGDPISGVIPGVVAMEVAATAGPSDWLELIGGVSQPLGGGTADARVTLRLPQAGVPSVVLQAALHLPL